MPIQDRAREDVVTASLDAPVSELAPQASDETGQTRDETVGSVVVTDGQVPVGIATARDLTARVIAEEADPNDSTAQDVMSEDLCAVRPEAGFYEAAEVMSENGVRRLPGCNDDDELVCSISADDLTELLADETEKLASVSQARWGSY